MYFCVYLKKKAPEKPLFSGVLFSTVLRYGSLLAGTKISQPAKASCDIGCGNLPAGGGEGSPAAAVGCSQASSVRDAPFGRSSATGGALFQVRLPLSNINKSHGNSRAFSLWWRRGESNPLSEDVCSRFSPSAAARSNSRIPSSMPRGKGVGSFILPV